VSDPAAAAVPLRRALPPVYAAATLRLVFPLLVLPLMAQRLGADEFGRLGLMLVWAGLLAIVVEGGFLGAATRLAVRATSTERLRLARQVFSARCVLCVPVLLAVVLAVWWPGAAAGAGAAHAASPFAAGGGWGGPLLLGALACALGWPATWYLQATSQLHRWARVEFGVLALMLLATLGFAHSVEGYLALQLAGAVALAALGWRWLQRDLRAGNASGTATTLWAGAEVRPGLRLGAAMLPVSLAGAAYSFALPALAAAGMPRSELGVYYLADRIVRALLQGSDPLVQLVYPRIVDRFAQGARVALRYAARWAAAGLLVGLAGYVVLYLGWPMAARALGTPEPARVQAVLAVAGLLLPLLVGWKFLGYWMLGSGRYDHAYRACIVIGGIFGASAAWAFAHDAVALATVAVAAEAVVIAAAVAGMMLTERRRA